MPIEAIVFDAYGTLYDVQSVSRATAAEFPRHADAITQIWRLKQLEYSWLRSMMGRYQDFRTVSRESLHYTLTAFGLAADAAQMARLIDAYDDLSPYPEAAEALDNLKGYQLAILSNGSPAMLDALARNSGLDRYLDAVISVDPRKSSSPTPAPMSWCGTAGRPPTKRRLRDLQRVSTSRAPPTSGSTWSGSSV